MPKDASKAFSQAMVEASYAIAETKADSAAYERMLANGDFANLAPGTLVVFTGGEHVLTTSDWDEATGALKDKSGLITAPVPLRD